MKSKLQKKKDNPRSGYWKKKADKAWAELIHSTERCAVGNYCAGNLEAHHLISRSNVLTRHEPLNGILLCSKHHKFDKFCSPHMGPLGFADWLQHNRPEQSEYVLSHRFNSGEKPDYEKAYNNLKGA